MALQQMWERAWMVITILLACSVLSAAVILERWKSLRQAHFDREALLERMRKLLMDNKRDLALAQCEHIRKPIGKVLGGLLEYTQENRNADRERLERLGGRLIRIETSRLGHYLTGLGTIGSVAPFIGLFGTVMGIIHAFRAISENAGGGPGVIANGIAEALITTALGLFVAIPAVVAYNLYTRKIERISEDMQLCSEEIIDLLSER